MGRVDEARRRAAAEAEALATGKRVAEVPHADTALLDDLTPNVDATPNDRATDLPLRPPAEAAARLNGHAAAVAPVIKTSPSIVERVAAASAEKLVVSESMSTASREQYRRLAAVLHAGQETSGLKVVMIASAVPAEGKTLTASNLALTLSESYQRRVLLIDADLRRPSLDTLFGIASPAGLSDGLSAAGDARLPIQQVSDRLAVLPAGRATTDPMAGLTSERMRRLIDEARSLFDWIIIDTPPIILLPDAHLLASMVDGALLVIRADSTPYDLVRRAVEAIQRERVLGVVLNSAKEEQHRGYGKYVGYYHNYEAEGAPRE